MINSLINDLNPYGLKIKNYLLKNVISVLTIRKYVSIHKLDICKKKSETSLIFHQNQ